jgi:molybdate transport system substrate-binding protein
MLAKSMKNICAALGVGLCVTSGTVSAEELCVLPAGALKEAYEVLVPQFERQSGHKVKTTWAGTAEITRRVQGGAKCDLLLLPDTTIDDFIKQGKVIVGSRVDIAKASLGVAVGPNVSKPDISTADKFKSAVLTARSLTYSGGPSGSAIAALFERMGIAAETKSKFKQKPGVPVVEMIARGEAEIGFLMVSELLHMPGITFVGPLPEALQYVTTFSAGIHAASQKREVAVELVRYLAAPAVAPVFRKAGLEPRS